jgi:hypothetical protein
MATSPLPSALPSSEVMKPDCTTVTGTLLEESTSGILDPRAQGENGFVIEHVDARSSCETLTAIELFWLNMGTSVLKRILLDLAPVVCFFERAFDFVLVILFGTGRKFMIVL